LPKKKPAPEIENETEKASIEESPPSPSKITKTRKSTPSKVEKPSSTQVTPGAGSTSPITIPLDEEMVQPKPLSPPLKGPPSPPVPPEYSPQALSPSDERTWAMLAHLSVLLNLVSGILGVVGAIAIYLVYKDRSRYVAYHSLQAFIFQLIWWVGGGALAGLAWVVSGVLSVILIGCCLMPFALIISFIPIAALIYGVMGAIQTSQGLDFKYWLIGDWIRSTLEES